jgi:hypothetical protein
MRQDVARARVIAPALISTGGLVWALVTANVFIVGHGGLEGILGLALIILGLGVEERENSAGDDRPRWVRATRIAGFALIVLGLGAAIGPAVLGAIISGVFILLVVPTAFVLAPVLISVWALRGSIKSRSHAGRLLAVTMLLVSISSLATSAVQPNVSIAASVAFGALVVALGISKARD